MPSWNVPDDEEIAFKMIDLCEKYFTREKFEKFFVNYMNSRITPFTTVNVWNHESFCAVLESLLSKRKIEICKWPWKGRLKIRRKNKTGKNRFFRFARVRSFVFARKFFLRMQQVEQNFPHFQSVH